MKILLVEDNTATADRLGHLIEKAENSMQLVVAGTLAEGLAKSAEINPDITLLDLNLPDADWRQTVAAIPKFHPPVLIVSEMADDPEVKAECYKAGAENVFSKRMVMSLVLILISAATSARMRRVAREIKNGEE